MIQGMCQLGGNVDTAKDFQSGSGGRKLVKRLAARQRRRSGREEAKNAYSQAIVDAREEAEELNEAWQREMELDYGFWGE